MWTRADLKAKGKANFIKNYGACVVISIILAILLSCGRASNGAATNSAYSSTQPAVSNQEAMQQLQQTLESVSPTVLAIIGSMMLTFAIAGILFTLFIANPLIVGGRRFYLENQDKKAGMSLIGYIFKKGQYVNTVVTMLVRNIFIALWSLLFIIPGVIKSYSYWMVEYILAENPSIDRSKAFDISKKTMKGQKWDTFVLDLSFLGWYLLSVCTCGLLAIFYVNPYSDATKAQLYTSLRESALQQGFATADDLPGYTR